MLQRTFETPTGAFTVVEKDGALVQSFWGGDGQDRSDLLLQAQAQLEAYFAKELTQFDLPLFVVGSETQRKICDQISAIPFGETREYGDLSRALNVPAQAIGQGCGRNPLPILIPCHRILSARGLGGFSGDGGVETKVWLLRHEGAAGLLI
ncbi:MAG: methylated-DNA--[protein]-cysteine S-methyltransferase [Thalassovita sp.]